MKKISYKNQDVVFIALKSGNFLDFLKKECDKQQYDFNKSIQNEKKFKCGLENTDLPYNEIMEYTYKKRDKSISFAYQASRENSRVLEVYISRREFSPDDMINILERRQKLFS